MDDKHRCGWAGSNPLMQQYHDTEWGVPERDSRMLWETLMLEGFQAGLSWEIILRKREAFRAAFAGSIRRQSPCSTGSISNASWAIPASSAHGRKLKRRSGVRRSTTTCIHPILDQVGKRLPGRELDLDLRKLCQKRR